MLAVIGGSGLESLDGFTRHERRQVATRCGEPSAALAIGACGGQPIVFLPRHGEPHVLPPHRVNYRANLLALREAGVDRVLAVNTVGGIHPSLGAGAFAVPHDLVDYTWGREHSFSDGSEGSVLQHVDFTAPFDLPMRARLIECLAAEGVDFLPQGVYAVTQGPRLETAAEIRRFERDGCDMVGMTAMPEAALARELGLRYAMLCFVVNPAAGKSADALSIDEMRRVMDAGMAGVRSVLARFIANAE